MEVGFVTDLVFVAVFIVVKSFEFVDVNYYDYLPHSSQYLLYSVCFSQ